MRFIDFFAGIGGFRLGMEMAGHECVGHCEIDNFADKSYRAMHMPKESEWFAKDIRTVEYGDLPKAECYCFGFPCQSFSIAGSRGGFSDTRGTLFFEVMRIAKERKPEYLFAENVAGLLSHDGGRTFGTILATLGELGYWWEYQVLNSKNFGVPQNRERVFIIGHLGGRGGREIFPLGENDKKIDTEYKQPKQIAIKQINHLDDWQGSTRQIDRVYSPKGLCPTLDAMGGGNREPKIVIGSMQKNAYAGDGKKSPTGEDLFTLTAQDRHGVMVKEATSKGYAILKPTRTEYGKKIRKAYESGDVKESRHNMTTLEPRTDGITNTITTVQKDNLVHIREATKQGKDNLVDQRYIDGISDKYSFAKKKAQEMLDAKGFLPEMFNPYNSQEVDEVSPTITACCDRSATSSTVLIKQNNFRIRRLTPKECWRLQGFPDWAFERAKAAGVSDSQLYKQAGNSVTVNVIYEIAKRLKESGG